MEKIIGRAKLVVKEGDITKEKVDAIVNAANSSLMGGGGVDGAIHRAGGPAILEDCKEIVAKSGRCKTGEAVITTGGNLPAKYVIHTVGPVYRGGQSGEPEFLAKAYKNSLRVAIENGLKTVTFPAISCGIYGYPHHEAAKIALENISEVLEETNQLEEVRMVLFGSPMCKVFEEALKNLQI